MNKVLLISMLVVGMSEAFARPTPVSDCRIRRNGQETGEIVNGDQFFQAVRNYSFQSGCSYGKMYYANESGRVYVNGRLAGDNLSNNEATELKRKIRAQYGTTCANFTCDEIRVLRGNEPVENELPGYGVPSSDE